MKDLAGKTFHCLQVIEYACTDTRGNALWVCRCDCGRETLASSSALTHGTKKSCGHLRRDWIRSKSALGKFFKTERKERDLLGVGIDDGLDELGAY